MFPVRGEHLLYKLGTNIHHPHYESIDDFRFPLGALQCLKKFGYDQLTTLDLAVGANIAIDNDCVIVADDDKDKALGRRVLAYLLPMLNNLSTNPYERSKGKRVAYSGCEALIICATKTSGRERERVAQFIRDCLSDCSVGSGRIEVQYRDNLDGIYKKEPHVLLTDVKSLESMRNSTNGYFLFSRLKYLVFEEPELYPEQHQKEISEVIAIAQEHNDHNKTSPLVLVFATNQWTSQMEGLFTDLCFSKERNTVAFFDQAAELIKFANVSWKLTFATGGDRDDDVRDRTLIDILSKGFDSSCSEVAICCSTLKTAHRIQCICFDLKLYAKIAGFADSAVNMDSWTENPKITIIPDNLLSLVTKRDYVYLIGFDGDRMKQTNYMIRSFPTLNEETKQIEKQDLVVNFLVTGREPNFLSFYKFSKSLDNVCIADELERIGDALVTRELRGMPMCSGIRLFGYCNRWTSSKCPLRHEFTEKDVQVENVVPCYGKIEFKIIRSKSPSEYICLLLNHRISSRDPILRSYSQEVEDYVNALNQLAREEALKTAATFENGKMYAVKDSNFDDCTVATLYLRSCDTAKSAYFHFDCLVTGRRFCTVPDKVFSIPSKGLSHLTPPPPLVTVIFGSARPPGTGEMDYSEKECYIAQKLTSERRYKAYVGLSVGNTIWARSILYANRIDVTQKDSCLRALMLAKGIMSFNPHHMRNLVELVSKLGEVYSGYNHLWKYDKATSKLYHNLDRGDTIQWRHLELSTVDAIKVTEIKATYVYGPWSFYGICSEFEKLLEKLEDELTKWVTEQNVYESYNVSEYLFLTRTVQEDSVVAVKLRHEDNDGVSWARGMVKGIDRTDVNSPRFEVFLVDFGETLFEVSKEDVRPIHKKIVSKLPFQAIALSLEHIKPVKKENTDWDRAANDTFMGIMIPNGYNTYFKAIAIQDFTDENVDCRSYHIVGLYRNEEIGNIMIKKNMAVEKIAVKDWVDRITKDANANKPLVENGDLESDEDEFFDALESLDDFDVNLETNNNHGAHSIEEGIKTLEKKLNELKMQPKKSVNRSSNGNSSKARNIPRGIFTSASGNCVPGQCLSLKSIFPQKKVSKGRKKQKTALGQEESQTSSTSAQLPQMKHPEVLWHQTQRDVIFTVMLSDVKEGDYNLQIENRSFISLQIEKPDGIYGFHLHLLGKVSKGTVNLSGTQLRIYLEKLNPQKEEWPGLLRNKNERFRWLKFNKDYIKEEDGEDVAGAVVPMHGVATVDNYDYGEDNDENLNDIEEDTKYFLASNPLKFNHPNDSTNVMEDGEDA